MNNDFDFRHLVGKTADLYYVSKDITDGKHTFILGLLEFSCKIVKRNMEGMYRTQNVLESITYKEITPQQRSPKKLISNITIEAIDKQYSFRFISNISYKILFEFGNNVDNTLVWDDTTHLGELDRIDKLLTK